MRNKTIEEPDDAITLLRAQQRDIDVLLKSFGRARSAAEKRNLVAEAGDLIAVHLALETRALRPVLLALGDDVACLSDDESADLSRRLTEVLERDVEDPSFDGAATKLHERLETHAVDVDRLVLKKLRARLPGSRLRRLAHEMRVLEFELRVNAQPPLGVLAATASA
ncbi:MAG: hypothetical protein JWM82_2460 [Myxococcales bacterium]|nr:hypothetical protein [Myxococcales bacterium]